MGIPLRLTPGEACTMMALIDAQRRTLGPEAVVMPEIRICFGEPSTPPQLTLVASHSA